MTQIGMPLGIQNGNKGLASRKMFENVKIKDRNLSKYIKFAKSSRYLAKV